MIGVRKIRKGEILYYAFAILLAFCDIAGGGNLNLVYGIGILFFFYNIPSKDAWKSILTLFLPFMAMIILELLLSNNTFDGLRVIVYTSKIFLNISIMSYIKRMSNRLDYFKVITSIYPIFLVLLFLSIITYGNNLLWRVGDIYNSFSKIRLEFFYSEPSALGEISSLLIILCFYFYVFERKSKKLRNMLLCFSVVLTLTFSVSSIVYTFISLVALFLFQRGNFKKKNMGYFLVSLLGILILFSTDNPIANRINAMLAGADGSFNYRWTATKATLPLILKGTKYWGLGLSNLNTSSGLGIINSIGGMEYKFANSFPYFVAENGFLGFLYLMLLLGYLVRHTVKKGLYKSKDFSLRISLLIYVIISQFAGGYFTDPIIWCVYGLICCDSDIFGYRSRNLHD